VVPAKRRRSPRPATPNGKLLSECNFRTWGLGPPLKFFVRADDDAFYLLCTNQQRRGMCTSRQRRGMPSSSNRPELRGVVLVLQSAALSEHVLLLCDNAAVLCAIKKWVGQGRKATLATAPGADILREIVCLLKQPVRAERATFLIKAKLRRGEPINERADTLAEEGREISDDDKRWDDRTDRMTFDVQKGNTMVRSVWTNSVRNAFRKQAGWAKLQEVLLRATAAKHCRE